MSQSKLMSFFSSATEKRKRDSDDSDESQPGPSTPKKTSRPRGFCDDWLVKYDWLYLENGKMKCHPCVNTRQNNPFSGSGCTNFRNSTLVRHQKTSAHTDALKGLKLQSDMKKSMKKAEHEQIQLQKSSLKSQRHIVQLRTVYCMAKNGISARNFDPLMKLQQVNGCTHADDYYKKPEIVCEMETVLSDQIEKSLLKNITNSPYIGLMLDETCDITVEKKLVIYCRYIKEGQVYTAYVGNKRVTDCTAEGLKVALCDFLQSSGILTEDDYSSLMGLGTDGAAVMVGCRGGLGVKLKEKNNMLIQVHCIAHRLNLAASQASSGIPYMQDYHRYIQLLYRFFSDSQVRYDKLRELQTLLHGEVKQVPEGTSVRWLSVESAVKMIFGHFDAIVLALEDDKDKTGKAAGLWKFFTTSVCLLVTALLIDVLTCIGILSLTFQKDSVNLSSIRHNVDSAISTFRTMRNGSETVNTVLQELGNNDGSEVKYKDITIKHNQNLTRQFESVRGSFLDKLIENLETRFPENELHILECFDKVFNPKRYPDNNLLAYGRDQLNTLCDHYSNLVTVERCKGQFLQFKHFVVSHKQDYGDFEKFTKLIFTDYADVYPDLVLLASIALVIPVSSAPCERGFSQQNILKSKLRNRLNPDRLNRLLMIRLNGPDEDMDFNSAARAFGSMKDRQK